MSQSTFTKAVFALVLTAGAAAWASDDTCSNATGDIQYTQFVQEGGPCCGRSEAKLIYKSKVIKDEQWINAGPGGGDATHTDTNPNLQIAFGPVTDLNNSGEDGNTVWSNYALNIGLATTDGKPVFSDRKEFKLAVSIVCTNTHSKVPPP